VADVFLSYARKERERAVPIKVALEALGLTVFFDVEGLDGGDVFPDVLDREVKAATAVVSLWSPWSLSRPWIRIECQIGHDRGVLVPATIEPINPLHDVPAAFYNLQHVDLTDFDGDTSDPGWIALVKALARKLKRPDLLEREARSHAHTSAEAADLREELETLRAQMGDLAAEKIAADERARTRAQAFRLIDNSLSRGDYRRFLGRFPDGAEAFEAERRLDQLENWAKVDKTSRGAIENWLTATSMAPFPALAKEARRVQRRASGDGQTGGRRVMAIAAILVVAVGAGWFLTNSPEQLPSEPVRQAEITWTDPASAGEPETGTEDDPAEPAGEADRDGAAWRAALSAGTVAAYEAYLEDGFTDYVRTAEAALEAHRDAVRRLQRALNDKGFPAGSPDGRLGRQTFAAIDAFNAARTRAGEQVAYADVRGIEVQPVNALALSVEWWNPAPEDDDSPDWGANQRVISLGADTPPPPPSRFPGDTFRDCAQCPEMVVIPSGTFTMGSPESEAGRGRDEGPQRTVRVSYQFAVGKTEVTWAEWEACVADGGCTNSGPDSRGGDEGWGKGSRPVINVSWNDAQSYAAWLSGKTGERYRLLSEAEWEYVARAGTETRFSWGDGDPICSRGAPNGANFSSCESDRTEPVGFSAPNAFGLHDMHGNVLEWTEDCYVDGYSGAPTDGSSRIVSDCWLRILRGGWWNKDPRYLRSASRVGIRPSQRFDRIGFRLARTL